MSAASQKKRRHHRTKIDEQFIAHPIRMIRSPAWMALTLNDRRILDCLESEHAGHGGMENSNLQCRYDDFVNFGVRRQSIATSLRRVRALGFVVITAVGRKAYGDIPGTASRYRLTYLSTKTMGPTHDWAEIKSAEDAEQRIQWMEERHQKALNEDPRSARNRSRLAYALMAHPEGEKTKARVQLRT